MALILRSPAVFGLALMVSTGAALAADPAPEAPVRIVLNQNRIEIAPDASLVNVARSELQILRASAIQSLGQTAIPYSETLQDLTIDEAYTLKKDGTKIAVAPSAIITQQRPGTSGVPMLTDQKQKVVIYPNVEVGDTLVNARTFKSKPLFPGLFASGTAFPQDFLIDKNETVYITPKSLPLYIDAKAITVEKTTDGDKLVYTVRTKVDNPKLDPAPYVSSFDRSPYLFVSTMKSWEQFAKVYAGLVEPKLTVTPKLQAKADELTAGVTDRREQVNKIYQWVAMHIRYVGIEFGQGGFIPHDPEEVLTNAYGDCKDHAILFATLLKAKGIAADLVAIHSSDHYTVPNIPVATVFNHMINYIPSLGLYADTTQRMMALGYLPRGEYGKSVLHIGAGLRKTPLIAEKDFGHVYSEHQKLAADGTLSGEGVLTAHGIAAGLARLNGISINSTGPEKVAAEILEKRGLPDATGRYVMAPATEPATPDYRATMQYSAPNQQMLLSGAPFTLPKAVMFEDLSSELWLGPVKAEKYKTASILPCYSGSGSDDYSLDLPAGKRLAALPADGNIEGGGLHYTAHWSQNGQTVTVKRSLALHFDEPLCRGLQLVALRDALAKIKADLRKTISLVNE